MTPKFHAVQKQKHGGVIVTSDGTVYKKIHLVHQQHHPSVGDIAYLGKRLQNQHHGNPTVWELWPITIEHSKFMVAGKCLEYPDYPKLWYGKSRYIFIRE